MVKIWNFRAGHFAALSMVNKWVIYTENTSFDKTGYNLLKLNCFWYSWACFKGHGYMGIITYTYTCQYPAHWARNLWWLSDFLPVNLCLRIASTSYSGVAKKSCVGRSTDWLPSSGREDQYFLRWAILNTSWAGEVERPSG